jgi:hypothetical protein
MPAGIAGGPLIVSARYVSTTQTLMTLAFRGHRLRSSRQTALARKTTLMLA